MKTLFGSNFRSPTNRFLLLSLLMHAIFVFTVMFWNTKKPQTQTITMEIIETSPAVAAAPTEKVEVNKADKKKKADLSVKIVDQDEKPVNNEVDDNSRFLSRHNQKVEKQTVAKNRGEFKNRQKEGPQGKDGSKEPENPMAKFLPQFDAVKAVQARDEREKQYELDAEGIAAAAKKQKKPSMEEGELAKLQKGTGNDAAKGSDVSQTLDYIKDLDPGIETLLSSKEFKFYTYFSRIRVQLNQHWTPKVRQKVTKIYKQGRRIASSDDMITRCLITLDKTGKLVKVQIIGNSGVVELDEAAIEAFRAAAPFPNPPAGMIDPDGTIKIRWDFILEA